MSSRIEASDHPEAIKINDTIITGELLTETSGFIELRGTDCVARINPTSVTGNGGQGIIIINYDHPDGEPAYVISISEQRVPGNRRGEDPETEVLVSIYQRNLVQEKQDQVLKGQFMQLESPSSNAQVPLGNESLLSENQLKSNADRFNLALRSLGLRGDVSPEEIFEKLREMGVSEKILDVMRKGSASASF